MPVDVGFDKDGKVLGFSRVYNVPSGAVPKGSFPMLMVFDTSDECESFISYCNTKLVRFLYYIGICGKTISEEFWRFIPDPGKFDHIFTDEELYKKYNLTQEEINIIESVIKERK
jgi:site-specific DNA-methyltransferase (adenine-specific)